MKEETIIAAIEELLYQHDCVVLPDLGAFIGNYRSARFSVFGHKLYPPSKEITFNPKLFKNDGLLVSHLAHEQEVTYEEAHKGLCSFVKGLKLQLSEDGSFLIGNVGKLVREGEKLFFFQNDASNFLLSSWGLRPLIVRPVEHQLTESPETKSVEGTKVVQESGAKEVKFRKSNHEIWRVAAVVLPLLAIGMLVFWTLPQKNKRTLDMAGVELAPCPLYSKSELPVSEFDQLHLAVFTPDLKTKNTSLLASSIFPNLHRELNRELIVSFNAKSLHPKDSTRVVMNRPGLVQPREYIVVLGCFSEASNARNYVQTLQDKGIEGAQIIDTYKGLNRVGIPTGFDREAAVSLLGNVREKVQPESWLARK